MPVQTYLKYMKEVLGVERIQRPQADTASAEPAPELIQVLFIDQKKWSAATMDLFVKMREAMKLTETQVEILFAENMSNSELQIKALTAKEIVCFHPEIFENLKTPFSGNILLTIGPSDLIQSPALKKQTWGDLQQVMKKLQP